MTLVSLLGGNKGNFRVRKHHNMSHDDDARLAKLSRGTAAAPLLLYIGLKHSQYSPQGFKTSACTSQYPWTDPLHLKHSRKGEFSVLCKCLFWRSSDLAQLMDDCQFVSLLSPFFSLYIVIFQILLLKLRSHNSWSCFYVLKIGETLLTLYFIISLTYLNI